MKSFIIALPVLFLFLTAVSGCVSSRSGGENYTSYTESEINYYQKVQSSVNSLNSLDEKEYELKVERLTKQR